MKVQRCLICGQPIDPDEEFTEGRDDPDLCSLCQEVTVR